MVFLYYKFFLLNRKFFCVIRSLYSLTVSIVKKITTQE